MQDISISTATVNSVIHCGQGAFERYAPAIGGNLFILTDSNVYALYGKLMGEKFGNAPIYIARGRKEQKPNQPY